MPQIGFKPFMAGECVRRMPPSREEEAGKSGSDGINHRANRYHDVNDNLPGLRQGTIRFERSCFSARQTRRVVRTAPNFPGMRHEFRDYA
jgi:hypothetical protein